MKDTNLRISGFANQVFTNYLKIKNKNARRKMGKKELLDAYAERLMKKMK